MKRPRRRLALRLAACAPIGAVLTVMAAWTLAVRGPVPMQVPSTLPPSNPWPFEPGKMVEGDHDPGPGIEWRQRGLGFELISRYSRLNDVRDSAARVDVRTGWPWPGMRAIHDLDESDAGLREDLGGIEAPSWMLPPKSSRGSRVRTVVTMARLPLRPLWPGFALDTAFYGTLVFLLWSAPGVLRRRRRHNRGQCTACGYDLTTIVAARCPECGRDI